MEKNNKMSDYFAPLVPLVSNRKKSAKKNNL